jgi:hypothetical protein
VHGHHSSGAPDANASRALGIYKYILEKISAPLSSTVFPSHLFVACFSLLVQMRPISHTSSIPNIVLNCTWVKKKDSYLPRHHDGDGPHNQVYSAVITHYHSSSVFKANNFLTQLYHRFLSFSQFITRNTVFGHDPLNTLEF